MIALKFSDKAEVILGNLLRRLENGLPDDVLRGILRWSAAFYLPAMDVKSGAFGSSPDFQFLKVAIEAAKALPAEAVAADFPSAVASRGGLSLWSDMAGRIVRGRERSEPWFDLVKDDLAVSLIDFIKCAVSQSATKPEGRLAIRMAWRLRELRSEIAVRDLLWSL